ncbi:MAG: hypothetical protein R6U26_02535 [Candidatus Undinarchaeales archaeon]
MTKKVVLDTSALIIHGKGKQNIFELCDKFFGLPQFLIPTYIKKELKRKSKGGRGIKGATKRAAKVAMQQIEQFKRAKITNPKKDAKTVDTALLNYAERNKYPICTNDGELRNRAKKKGIKVIYASDKYLKRVKER